MRKFNGGIWRREIRKLRIFLAFEESNKTRVPDLKRIQDRAIPGVMGGYQASAHPDLIEILHDLAPDPAVRKGYAFGRPVMAAPTGLVFAGDSTLGKH